MQGEDFALVVYFCFHRRDELCISSYPSYKKSKSSLSRKLSSFFFSFQRGKYVTPDNETMGCKGIQNDFSFYSEIL